MKPFFFPRMLFISIIISFTHQPVSAHFGMVIPSSSMITQNESRIIQLTLSFAHPFEQVGMDLPRPKSFGVVTDGKRFSLLKQIKQTKRLGHLAWQADYQIRHPGIHTFYLEPEPYWEETEDRFIIHYTKTIVAAFGDDEGWDEEIGLKTEIVPLTRPFGLYVTNLFQGIVKFNGRPVPFADIEIEHLNFQNKSKAPNPYMITQKIKADVNGLFSYVAPQQGWWGFAALSPADYQLAHRGEKKDVELGAIIWVQFHDWM